MSKWRTETAANLGRLGITKPEHIAALIRASATLRTWAEHECNGAIQRDEVTDLPFRYICDGPRAGERLSDKPIADREKRALERVQRICSYYKLGYYQQGDPRGCALYIYRGDAIPQCPGSNDEASNGKFCRYCSRAFDEASGLYHSVLQQPVRVMVPAHRIAIATCYNSYGVAVVP